MSSWTRQAGNQERMGEGVSVENDEMTRVAAGKLAKRMWNQALALAAKHFPHTNLAGQLVCDCGEAVGSAGKWYQHILSFQEREEDSL
jgi:hypothetical protein